MTALPGPRESTKYTASGPKTRGGESKTQFFLTIQSKTKTNNLHPQLFYLNYFVVFELDRVGDAEALLVGGEDGPLGAVKGLVGQKGWDS